MYNRHKSDEKRPISVRQRGWGIPVRPPAVIDEALFGDHRRKG
ncbi:hypothetical protein B4135_0821 [Caldibacillus debilis]|uniref:Uncharacterized protein n=1 Tax=Caldibacillus debilis TaxID=301148 RepID=A0A150M6T4_9BACI|nr:hypothetical protein B4135_0821 [Caldibacillus debilis]